MPDPLDDAVLDNESGGNSVLRGGLHPGLRHAVLIPRVGDMIVHLVAHVVDELLHRTVLVVLPNAYADERNIVILVGDLSEVGNTFNARSTPRRPELDHVNLSLL